MGITKKVIIKEKMLGSFIKFSQISRYQEKGWKSVHRNCTWILGLKPF